MRAKTADVGAIVLRPPRRIDVVLAWCRQRPREVTATALIGLTALAGLAPVPATSASASPSASIEGVAAASERAQDPAVVVGERLYALPPLYRPADGPVPVGKGMWLHKLDRAENGDVGRIVNQAKSAGLSHLYVRLGSSRSGFYARGDLDRLLPAAHAAGLKIVGWDFVYLDNPSDDAARARQEIGYATAAGDRIDAFSADIETRSEGTRLVPGAVSTFGAMLRQFVGPGYPLIATVPRPTPKRWFPYNELTSFDAIAPMVYWGNRDPAADVAGAMAALAPFEKPVMPVGQAYDMAQDGAPASAHGAPSKAAVERFIRSASDHGAKGLSFWVWDTATPDQWAAITAARLS